MRIALTGATGFIGRYIAAHLAEQGHGLRCWYRSTSDRGGLEPLAESIQWVEGGLTLTWNPIAAGTRGVRGAALEAQGEAMSARLVEARRAAEVEVRAALARLATARGALGVGERGVEQATETLRVERERHRVGRVTTNDLLEAEAALYERTLLQEIARLEVARSWVQLWLAMGEDELPAGI